VGFLLVLWRALRATHPAANLWQSETDGCYT
jgi:hypothetical protein